MRLIKLIICILFPTLLFAQKSIDQEIVQNIIIPGADSTIKVGILTKSKQVKIKDNLLYYWYKSNKIYKNKGGFDGKLLHGVYNVYNSDGKLYRSGEFLNGNKNGNWKLWNEHGELLSSSEWSSGILNGSSKHYNQKGQLSREESYKNGILHGKTIIYDSDQEIQEIHFYKNGNLKLSFTDKIFIWFKKRKNENIVFKPEPIKKEKETEDFDDIDDED